MPKNICEDQATGALKMLGCYYHNSNSQKPEVDKIACYKGRSVRIECKYTAEPHFDANKISLAERRCLTWHERNGGLSVVMLMQTKPHSRAWLCTWKDFIFTLLSLNGAAWCHHYFGRVKHEYVFAGDGLRSRASGKLYFDSLPVAFWPLEKAARTDFRGGRLGNEWDFKPFFDFHQVNS